MRRAEDNEQRMVATETFMTTNPAGILVAASAKSQMSPAALVSRCQQHKRHLMSPPDTAIPCAAGFDSRPAVPSGDSKQTLCDPPPSHAHNCGSCLCRHHMSMPRGVDRRARPPASWHSGGDVAPAYLPHEPGAAATDADDVTSAAPHDTAALVPTEGGAVAAASAAAAAGAPPASQQERQQQLQEALAELARIERLQDHISEHTERWVDLLGRLAQQLEQQLLLRQQHGAQVVVHQLHVACDDGDCGECGMCMNRQAALLMQQLALFELAIQTV